MSSLDETFLLRATSTRVEVYVWIYYKLSKYSWWRKHDIANGRSQQHDMNTDLASTNMRAFLTMSSQGKCVWRHAKPILRAPCAATPFSSPHTLESGIMFDSLSSFRLCQP